MELIEGIFTRRSIRRFTPEPIGIELLRELVSAGTLAPSGLNNQPWRFVIVKDRPTLDRLASMTRYAEIIESSAACIAVFIDRSEMYHEVKDHQAIGACIQNILLAAHAKGLGGVWLGEILKNSAHVREMFGLPEGIDLMAVVALGHPVSKPRATKRKPIEDVILKEI